MRYTSDLVYLDAYGAMNTREYRQPEPMFGTHPAIASGQLDFPMTYAGVTGFLEANLTPLRAAEKVS